MIEIHYLRDKNGEQQVIKELQSIVEKAKYDDGYATLSKYINQALSYLMDVGVPRAGLLPFVTEYDDKRPLTFASITKKLKYHYPLMEFRVNWRGTGYFRAIFFGIKEGNKQHLYFTKALVKQDPNPPEFNQAIDESEQILKKFISNYEGEITYV